ncbi:hypothetical protein GGF46_004425 [Coemansia sp. RSA 552]|nr:hypothetical protein GGF46_004425 [Coemansia sp. RSA 552]
MNSSTDVDLDNPTPAQRAEAIDKLREHLSTEVNGYCSDLEKAAAMLNGWYQWRTGSGIDDLPVAQADNTYPVPYPIRGFSSVADANLTAGPQTSDLQLKLGRTFGGGCWHKRDKEGRPIYIERAGRCQVKDISKSTSQSGLVEFQVLMQEFLTRTVLPECSQLAGRTVSQQVVILDLAGASLGMLSHIPALNMLREMLARDQLCYPECMHRTFIVNAPAMFVTAWKLIRSWLDPRVISKICILGKDHAQELLREIPAASLPAFLGGSCRCLHMPGGCVPSIPMGNIPDFPRTAYVNMRHRELLSYDHPHHTFVFDVAPTDYGQDTPPSQPSTPISSPLMGYASWLGIRRDSPRPSAPSSPTAPRTRYVFVRFVADRGRGIVVEVLWRAHREDESGVLVYPEVLFDPQRGPVVLELEAPNRAGQLVFNWRIATFDEGQAPFPSAEEARIPIQLEYSVDLEEAALREFSLAPIKRD